MAKPVYVHFGCGFTVGKDWNNFDNSLTLRIERIPVFGRLLGSLARNSQPFPTAVQYGDICSGLPIADGTAQGVYASHVLEHLSYAEFKLALANIFKLLRPGGEFRLIVPDVESRARLYIAELDNDDGDAAPRFMRSTMLGVEHRPRRLLGRLRQIFGGSAHLWMWDEKSMVRHLTTAGFTKIRRCQFGDSDDGHFAQVEEIGRFIDASGIHELAISACKPAP